MATQPPPAPRKTRRSQTVLSPVPTEIPDGAIMVHSTDSTIAVPSHGGDSVAQRVKRANPRQPSMAAIQALQGRSAGAQREIEAAAPPRRRKRGASTPAGRAPKKAKKALSSEAASRIVSTLTTEAALAVCARVRRVAGIVVHCARAE